MTYDLLRPLMKKLSSLHENSLHHFRRIISINPSEFGPTIEVTYELTNGTTQRYLISPETVLLHALRHQLEEFDG